MKRIKLFAAACMLLLIACLPACLPAGLHVPAAPSASAGEESLDSSLGTQPLDADIIQYPEPPNGDVAVFFTVREILNLLDPYMEQKGYGKVSEWEFSYDYGFTYHYNEYVSIELNEVPLSGRLESVHIKLLPESGEYEDTLTERDLAVFEAIESYLTGLFELSEVEEYDYYRQQSGELFWSELMTIYGKSLKIYPRSNTVVPVKVKPFDMTKEEIHEALDSISTGAGRIKFSEWPTAPNYYYYDYDSAKVTEQIAIATYYDGTSWSGRRLAQLDLILYRKGASEDDITYFFELAKGVIRLFEPKAGDAIIAKLGLDALPRISMVKSEKVSFHFATEGNLARLLINPVGYHKAVLPFTREELTNVINEALSSYGLDALESYAVTEAYDGGEAARQYHIDEGCCLTLYEDETGHITKAMLHYSDDLAGLSGRKSYEPMLKALLAFVEPERNRDIWNTLGLDNFKTTHMKVANGLISRSQYTVYNDERNFRIWSLNMDG